VPGAADIFRQTAWAMQFHIAAARLSKIQYQRQEANGTRPYHSAESFCRVAGKKYNAANPSRLVKGTKYLKNQKALDGTQRATCRALAAQEHR